MKINATLRNLHLMAVHFFTIVSKLNTGMLQRSTPSPLLLFILPCRKTSCSMCYIIIETFLISFHTSSVSKYQLYIIILQFFLPTILQQRLDNEQTKMFNIIIRFFVQICCEGNPTKFHYVSVGFARKNLWKSRYTTITTYANGRHNEQQIIHT